jgi:Fe-S oxidoreductase
MTVSEGSLASPTRHALDWKSADFYDEPQLIKEFERIFGICHGCRRCVNLCTAFPTLFDLIDEGATGELDGVDKNRFWDVVDRCYLCDMCYMSKCPYVPPHPWNVDFPHTMLRGKAVKFRKGEVKIRDRLLSSTDAVGKLATIPVVVQFVNAANRSGFTRGLMDRALGIHKDRMLPEYSASKFRRTARPNAAFPVNDGKNTPGKVALFATCYINCNEPGIGHDLLTILAHNEIPVTLVEKEACCGMPKLELGDLDAVSRLKAINIPVLAPFARAGYAILSAVPSCTLMFKQELPLMFPDEPDVKAVAEAMFDPFEYLVLRYKDQLLRTDFTRSLGRISYHVPCHLRVQNIGQKTREFLERIPGTVVTTVERCSGHDGTWGVKSEYFEQSMKIGRHIEQGIGKTTAAAKQHPLTLVRMAYGL